MLPSVNPYSHFIPHRSNPNFFFFDLFYRPQIMCLCNRNVLKTDHKTLKYSKIIFWIDKLVQLLLV